MSTWTVNSRTSLNCVDINSYMIIKVYLWLCIVLVWSHDQHVTHTRQVSYHCSDGIEPLQTLDSIKPHLDYLQSIITQWHDHIWQNYTVLKKCQGGKCGEMRDW